MRLDRVVTLLAFRALGSLARGRSVTRLPVLMYHSVSASQEKVAPYYRTSTHPSVFEQQMRLLDSAGYAGVTLSRGLNAVRSRNFPLDGRQPVALTFDDGYRDFLTAAVPVLERYGFKATMYLPTGFIDENRQDFQGRECLTWGEVSDLHNAGFEFGSHTVTHSRLVTLPWDEIQRELILSKRAIDKRLGADVTAFSYPYAFPQQNRRFTERFANLLRASGYRSGVTTMIGCVSAEDDAFSLKRLPVNSGDDSELLCAKLRGFYNWMAGPQSAVKKLKGVPDPLSSNQECRSWRCR